MRPQAALALIMLTAGTAGAKVFDTAAEALLAPYSWEEDQRLELESFPSYIRPSLADLVAGYNGFRPGITPQDTDEWLARQMAGLERGFIVLGDSPSMSLLARDYTSSAPLSPDWESRPGRPLEEAVHAVTWLRQDPDTPLEPFLLILAAHRARAAWECYASLYYPEASEPVYAGGMQTAADIYGVVLSEALSHPDPAVQWLAGELDDLPWAYMDVSGLVPSGTRAGP